MVTSTSDVTGSSALAVRGTSVLTAGLVSAAVAGSILLVGNTHTDRGASVVPQVKLGTGAYQVYTDVTCSNTGGLAKYSACSIQNPLTGTGVLTRIQLDSAKAPAAATVTCMTSPDGSATGTVLFKYQATASGRSILSTPRGEKVSSGAVTLPPSWYVRCWHSSTPGSIKEQLRVWFNELYVP